METWISYNSLLPRNSYEPPDLWPHVHSIPKRTKNPETRRRKVESAGQDIVLQTGWTPFETHHDLPLHSSFWILEKQQRRLADTPRWEKYKLRDNGDMNGYLHALRLRHIAVIASELDAGRFGLSALEQDALRAAAELYVLGDPNTVISEIENLESITPWEREVNKEIFLFIASGLSEEEIFKLIGPSELLVHPNGDSLKWEQLRELFTLYQSINNMITAIQSYPFRIDSLSYDRDQAEFFRDIAQEHWPKLVLYAQANVPSIWTFFNNYQTESILRHANRIMPLGLDTSLFAEEVPDSIPTAPVFNKVDDLTERLKGLRGKRIVLTGGTFDLFHKAHLEYLQRAKTQGDILIVHVDGDIHTRKRKGPTRPVIDQNQRAAIVSSLPFVDFVLITDGVFYADSNLIAIKPDIIVKTKRKSGKSTTSSELATHYPAIQVVEFSEEDSISTTKIINKIKNPVVELTELSVEDLQLRQAAMEASKRSYSYSNFSVGSAVIDENEQVHQGCNLSNASPTLATCAERHAITTAVVNGARNIRKIVIYSPGERFIMPCGSCRQAILEFSNDDNPTSIIITNDTTQCLVTNITELLPNPFTSHRRKTS